MAVIDRRQMTRRGSERRQLGLPDLLSQAADRLDEAMGHAEEYAVRTAIEGIAFDIRTLRDLTLG